MLLTQDSIAQRQQHLVEKIFFPTQQRGLTVYQNNLLFTASRALELTYPVLTQLLGKEAMKSIAHSMLISAPPTTGNWADWGQPLKDVICTTPLAVSYPFLPDVAALEWALHECGRREVCSIDTHKLASFKGEDLLQATIRLSPAIRLVTSNFPVDHIWQVHQTETENNSVNEAAFMDAIRQHKGPVALLIFQRNKRPQFIRISDSEWLWLTDITNGTSISNLLHMHPTFDFTQWLTDAITQNWIADIILNSHQTTEGATT